MFNGYVFEFVVCIQCLSIQRHVMYIYVLHCLCMNCPWQISLRLFVRSGSWFWTSIRQDLWWWRSLCVNEWIIKADYVKELLWVISANQRRAAVYLGHAILLSAEREVDREGERDRRKSNTCRVACFSQLFILEIISSLLLWIHRVHVAHAYAVTS